MDLTNAHTALKQYFGYDSFRPMQAEIIQAVYDKRDALVLMPTGGGKSICYQIPAITLEGMCVVVSPLISLMKDQVESLRANGINAAFLNSSLDRREQKFVEDEIYHQRLQLLYVSPERMVAPGFLPLIQQAKINLFAIDEAHCISSWGHDFRPEYTQLKFLKRQFKNTPVIALTATADKVTRKDIVQQLGFENPAIFIASFDRPNISLEVRPGQKRLDQIIEFIRERPNTSGIVYCLSRKSTETVARKLLNSGIVADYYHAGLPAKQRAKVQEEFINDNLPIVCATVAFGMGIDKSNVRWVIHYNLPKNMEGYYQEIGRAGRDGAKAEALLFYSYNDVIVMRDILKQNDSDHLEIKLAKLDRIQQYVDAFVCRRKVLLSYFGENLEKDCGNCDICKNPPNRFDGTIISQKALSAIYRLKERVAMGVLIDVLRGSRRKEILARGYDRIKTYGMGADISTFDWQQLLHQMINLGLIEVAYDEHNFLKLTAASRAVLFDNRKVELVKMTTIKERRQKQKAKAKVKTKRQRVRDELFEALRQIRKTLAQQRGVPPYIIFSDASLEEMAAEKPRNEVEFRRISGVGEQKLQQYGAIFIQGIRQFMQDQPSHASSTQLETYQLHKRGFSADQIATQRQLSSDTIHSHLLELYQQGQDINLSRLISKKEVKAVLEVLQGLPEPYKLRPIYDRRKGQFDFVVRHLSIE
ncbi:MAG: DNA helicase RecQ, partial [Bacteroidota bacterium]